MTTSFLGARLLQAVQGDFERRTGGDRALDQQVELAVVQQAPPLRRLKRTIDVTIARRIERRRCRGEMGRQRRRRRKIVGTDRARGQGRAHESAENGGAVSRRAAVGATTATTPKLCRPQHGPVHSNSPTRRGPEQQTSACSSADAACTNHLRMVSPCDSASELSAGHASDR